MAFQGSGRGFRIAPEKIADPNVREVFEVFRRYIQENPLLTFRGKILHFYYNSDISSDVILPHGLGFRPKHAMFIKTPSSYVTSRILFDNFDEVNIKIYVHDIGNYDILVGSFGD